MAKALILGETKNGGVTKTSKEAASKAAELGLECEAIVFGGNKESARELGNFGAGAITFVETPDYNGEVFAEAIIEKIKQSGSQVVLIPHSWMGRDVAGRIGAALNSPVIADVIDLKAEGDRLIARKPVYAGKAFVNLKSKAEIQIFTVRSNAFEVKENAASAQISEQTADISSAKAKRVDFQGSAGSKVGLTEADIIISGGRGIKGPEFFPVLQEIADMLGAALGASRATVDAGWIDHSHQVGQTGKTVSPLLYIAVGISGAIQHLAGMGSSKYIVAINKDPEAPIFKVTSFGVVDDLFDVIPPLKEEIQKLKG